MQYEDIITNSRWRTNDILKIVFGYISAPYWPINAKFGSKMKNHMQIRSRDQNGNYRKFKMAYGRHFENSFIAISQPLIIHFRSNLISDANFHSEDWNFANSKWRSIVILKIFLQYFVAILADLWIADVACKHRSRDQNINFRKFNMAAASMLNVSAFKPSFL